MNQSWNARAHGRKLALGLALSGLTAVIAQGGCASSDTPEFILLPDAGVGPGNTSATGGSTGSGTGGSFGTGGSSASGGSFGSGGNPATGGSFGSGGNRATGGTIGSGGSTGSGGAITGSGGSGSGGTRATGGTGGAGGARATGGSTGSGGTTGVGGMRASGGTTGSGGAKATGGSTGSGGSSGTATFTQIYQQILTVSCAGSQCHNPGSQKGISFSSQSTAYSAVKSRVTAGNATGSSFYSTVNSGSMPPGGKLPAAQIQMIADWINAGAMNN